MACALSGDADEYLGRGNNLETAGVALTDSGLVVAEAVEVLQQFEAVFQGQRGVFVKGKERGRNIPLRK